MNSSLTQNFEISLSRARASTFSSENHQFITIPDFLIDPDAALQLATLQKFARITPQYPGIRAPLPEAVIRTWLVALSPVLDRTFGGPEHGWRMEAWFSIVTTPPSKLIPMQCFPHVDGTDPNQIAMMLYLHRTGHGGTGFFRHRSTGFEALTHDNFGKYRGELEADVKRDGLPAPAYTTNGAPFFERTHESSGRFNEGVFYRGNLLHSGIIDNSAELSPDPLKGRLTINAFFRPNAAEQSVARDRAGIPHG